MRINNFYSGIDKQTKNEMLSRNEMDDGNRKFMEDLVNDMEKNEHEVLNNEDMLER